MNTETTEKLIPIRTIADFKRALKLGAKVGSIRFNNRYQKNEAGEFITEEQPMPIREASIVQTNSFALKTTKSDGKIVDSWCPFPAKSEVHIENNIVTILEEDLRLRTGADNEKLPMIPILKYWILAE